MHRDRVVSATARGSGERKRIGEPMEMSSISTSWGLYGSREKERIAAGKQPEVPRSGGGSTAMPKSNLSDGEPLWQLVFLLFFSLLILQFTYACSLVFSGPFEGIFVHV
jgi:hypothetical protein